MSDYRYIAELKGARELALHGAADPAWWRPRLADEGLELVERDGAAHVVVTGIDARWLGWPFRDLSVSVAARRAGEDGPGAFLARAFNASRVMVFFESRWFGLPYARRSIGVASEDGTSFELGAGDLRMARAGRDEDGPGEDTDEQFPIFLPRGRDAHRWLMLRIRGRTTTSAFDAARDRFEVPDAHADPILAGLRASGFRGVGWHVRNDAAHARTKTFCARG